MTPTVAIIDQHHRVVFSAQRPSMATLESELSKMCGAPGREPVEHTR